MKIYLCPTCPCSTISREPRSCGGNSPEQAAASKLSKSYTIVLKEVSNSFVVPVDQAQMSPKKHQRYTPSWGLLQRWCSKCSKNFLPVFIRNKDPNFNLYSMKELMRHFEPPLTLNSIFLAPISFVSSNFCRRRSFFFGILCARIYVIIYHDSCFTFA